MSDSKAVWLTTHNFDEREAEKVADTLESVFEDIGLGDCPVVVTDRNIKFLTERDLEDLQSDIQMLNDTVDKALEEMPDDET